MISENYLLTSSSLKLVALIFVYKSVTVIEI